MSLLIDETRNTLDTTMVIKTVDEARNTLDTTTAVKTADSRLGDTLDVVMKDLAVTLGMIPTNTVAVSSVPAA